MKKTRIYLLALAVLSVIFACDNDPEPLKEKVTFKTKINPTTKATASNFEDGDEIGVSSFQDEGMTQVKDLNVAYVYDENTKVFVGINPIAFDSEGQELSFRAVYPYDEENKGEFVFEINDDQSEHVDYSKSDLMVAELGLTDNLQPELVFEHKMSMLVLDIVKSDIVLSEAEIRVKTRTKVNVNLDSRTYIGTGSLTPVLVGSNGNMSYKVIISPQTMESMDDFITIEVADNVYVLPVEAMEFKSGMSYNYDISIDSGNLSFVTEITSWQDGGNITPEPADEGLMLSSIDPENLPEEDNWVIVDRVAESGAIEVKVDAQGNAVLDEDLKPTIIGDGDFKNLFLALKAAEKLDRIITLEFPNLEKIPHYALFDVSKMENTPFADPTLATVTSVGSIIAPVATSIGESALFGSSNLVSVSAPNSEVIHGGAFSFCAKIENLEFLEVEEIKQQAFAFCMGLKTLIIPKVKILGLNVFSMCPSLTSLDLPEVEILEGGAFTGSNLTSISLPKAKFIGPQTFTSCAKLHTISIPKAEEIGEWAFNKCNALETLIVATDSEITDVHIEAFGVVMTEIGNIDLTTAKDNGTTANLDTKIWTVPYFDILTGKQTTVSFGSFNSITLK